MQREALPPEISLCETSPFPAAPPLPTSASDADGSCRMSTHDASAAGAEQATVFLTVKGQGSNPVSLFVLATNHQDSVL